MAAISTRQAFEFVTDIVISPLTSYIIEKAHPTPHRTPLLAFSIVDAIVRHTIRLIALKVENNLTEKAGYKDQGKVTNHKFMHLSCSMEIAIVCLLPIFYRFVGQQLNLQLPNYLITIAYLTLYSRSSGIVIHTVYAFSPSLRDAK